MQRTWTADRFDWPAPQREGYSQSIVGDCFDTFPGIETGSVDMLLTDPPYGTTRNRWDDGEFGRRLPEFWEQVRRIVRPDGCIAVMAAPPFDKMLAASNLDDYRYDWVWHKNKATGHLNAKRQPLRAHEYICIFYRERPIYNPQRTLGHAPTNAVSPATLPESELRNYGHHNTTGNPGGETSRAPRSVLNIPVLNNDSGEKFHPTQKPVELMEHLIRTYTDEGDLVLDPFAGAGTTAAAAVRCGRDCISIERDPEYAR